MEKIGRIIATGVLSLGVGFGVGCWIGSSKGRTDMTIEAVKNNFGHYRIINELGHTQFQWGPPPPGSTTAPAPKQ